MLRKHLLLLLGLAALLPSSPLAAADAAKTAETRMRESLRNTMIQLRTAETERATLQAVQAENEQKIKTLTAQVETLTKRCATDKDASDKSIADLGAKLEERNGEIATLREAIEKWKVSHKQAADLAAAKESQRAKLADDIIVLNRRVADQQTRNEAMFKLGGEILTRYKKFGLGEALTAREPFTGLTRVKFQNLIQDYQDQLTDQKIKP